jgi:aerobic carbon-monoxide dehydrogenase medium subunit
MSFPELLTPETVEQAVEFLATEDRKTLIFGGGTLVQPLITLGVDDHDAVLDLEGLRLSQIILENDLVSCGAMVRLSQLAQALPQEYIQAAVSAIGGPALRNLATIGGNLFAKPPYGDLATLLLALDAELEFADQGSRGWISLNEFYNQRDHDADRPALVIRVRFSAAPKRRVVFRKLGRKHLNTASVVTVAISLLFAESMISEARLALGGIGHRPLRVEPAERVLVGSSLTAEVIELAAQAALQNCDPRTDVYASAWYRKRMIPVQIRRALNELNAREAP